MNWTKPEMWISILAVVLIFTFSIIAVGTDLSNNSAISLDNESQDYINEFSANVEANNLSGYQDNATLQKKETNPLLDVVNNLPVISDVVGGINFFIDKGKELMGMLSIIYNIPSFFIQGFGLPVGAFNHVINILGYILFIAFLIIMVRIAK